MDLAQNNFSTLVYGNGGGRGPATCVYAIMLAGRLAGGRNVCMRNSAKCAARHGNFEIAKEPELISQQRKVIFKKQVYHSDQYKNWTSMICFVAYF